MARAVIGGLTGAAGATAYYNAPDVQQIIRSVLLSPRVPGSSAVPSELEGLQKMVEQLSREFRRGQPVTVVTTPGHGRTSGTTYLVVLVAGGLGVLYLRFVKGWRFGDLFFVSRAAMKEHLTEMKTQVTGGLAELQKRVQNVSTFLMEQIKSLSKKQEEGQRELRAGQSELKGQVGQVDSKLESTREDMTQRLESTRQQVTQHLDSTREQVQLQLENTRELVTQEVMQVHEAVRVLETRMESSLEQLGSNVGHATQGIHVLCKVIAEIVSGGPKPQGAIRDLHQFVNSSPLVGASAPVRGLEAALDAAESGKVVRGPFRKSQSARFPLSPMSTPPPPGALSTGSLSMKSLGST